MHFSLLWVILLAAPWLQTSENAGIEMTIRHTFSGNSSDQNFYLLGDRKRVESRNGLGRRKRDGSTQWITGSRVALITRCDLGQIFELNLDAGEYESAAYPPKPWSKDEIEALGLSLPAVSPSGAPTLRIETTTVDTGERKDFFGHLARHVISARRQVPLACSRAEPQETLTEGWYVDLHPEVACNPMRAAGKRGHAYLRAGGEPAEKPEFVDIGEPETGFGVQLVMTHKGSYKLADGTRKEFETKNEMLVTELREGPLDLALFEIPAGFKPVEHIERNPRVAGSSSRLGGFWERLKSLVE